MADPVQQSVPTPNYSFNLPAVGGDDNAWGGMLNDNWSSIDTILWDVSGVANAALTQGAADARYLQLTGGTLGPNSLIVNGPAQFNNYVGFTNTAAFSGQAQFTGGATFGTAQVFFNSQVTFSADALMVTPAASDNSNRAATTAWVNGAIAALPAPPAPSNAAPAMNGTAAPGSSALYARGDHVHPTDTSRAPVASPTFTGTVTLPADPTASLQAATKQYADAGVAAIVGSGAEYGGFVNKLRNGTFDVWQRGTSITVSSLAYTADGWLVSPVGANVTVQRGALAAAAPVNGASFMQITGATGVTSLILAQRIESYVAAQLAGQTVTFSCWAACSVAMTPQVSCGYFTAIDNPAGTTNVLPATNLQPLPSGVVWTRLAITFAMPMGAQNGVVVNIPLGAFASGTFYITAADLRATPGVATGLNANPPPPELRPIATEMVFCQRYFWDAANGSSAVAFQANGNGSSAAAFSTATIRAPTRFRINPTIVVRNQAYNNASAVSLNSGQSTDNIFVSVTTSAAGYFNANFNFTASAEL